MGAPRTRKAIPVLGSVGLALTVSCTGGPPAGDPILGTWNLVEQEVTVDASFPPHIYPHLGGRFFGYYDGYQAADLEILSEADAQWIQREGYVESTSDVSYVRATDFEVVLRPDGVDLYWPDADADSTGDAGTDRVLYLSCALVTKALECVSPTPDGELNSRYERPECVSTDDCGRDESCVAQQCMAYYNDGPETESG